VAGITPTSVLYTTKDANGKTQQHSIPTNFVLWSTGIAMNPFTQRVSDLLPNQVHKKAIEVDSHLRVVGAPKGQVYAIGDCSTVRGSTFQFHLSTQTVLQIETSLLSHFMDLVEECDTDKDGKIDFGEWELMGTYFFTSRDNRVYAESSVYLQSYKDQTTYPHGRGPPRESEGTLPTL